VDARAYQPPPGTGFSATTANPLQINGAGIGQTTLSDRAWRSLGFEIIGTVPEAFRHPRSVANQGLSCPLMAAMILWP
jgi:hypothetical protein